ncbi:hypothetical protein HX001_04925 [Empedobacter brevis]|uniref:Uncharacterized protein n=2 Tax=Empedobacter brevis TaxID=247 RepID=A0AAJ1V7C7_9FLAO|nr:hypothetical protein [Empedobacter brevis]MDM1071837.1 hypothetical protein [Empedobacter brevis]QHC86057.1 hypothetical protein AS589_15310 [Empedobacter brevis]
MTMEITQEKIDFATIKVENHLIDLGIKNNFSLLRIEESEEKNIRIFYYEIASPTFKTIIQIQYDFLKEEQKDSSQTSFSWMDYKKITE